jgi:hypothetical protein
MNAYDSDGFSTLTLRCGRDAMAASSDGPSSLHFGDALTVVLAVPPGITDPANILFGIYSESGAALCAPVAQDSVFAWVPGTADRAYQNITLNTPAAQALAATLESLDYADVRAMASLADGRVFLDVSLRFFSNPHYSNAGATVLPRDFIPKATLYALLTPISTMPTHDAVAREARFAALLAALLSATAPTP